MYAFVLDSQNFVASIVLAIFPKYRNITTTGLKHPGSENTAMIDHITLSVASS